MDRSTYKEKEHCEKYLEISRKATSAVEVMNIISELTNGHEGIVDSQNGCLGILYKRAMDLAEDSRELLKISECCHESNIDISKQSLEKAMTCAKTHFEIPNIAGKEYEKEDFGKEILLRCLDGCNNPEQIAYIASIAAYLEFIRK
jgi:hypothetical protein